MSIIVSDCHRLVFLSFSIPNINFKSHAGPSIKDFMSWLLVKLIGQLKNIILWKQFSFKKVFINWGKFWNAENGCWVLAYAEKRFGLQKWLSTNLKSSWLKYFNIPGLGPRVGLGNQNNRSKISDARNEIRNSQQWSCWIFKPAKSYYVCNNVERISGYT